MLGVDDGEFLEVAELGVEGPHDSGADGDRDGEFNRDVGGEVVDGIGEAESPDGDAADPEVMIGVTGTVKNCETILLGMRSICAPYAHMTTQKARTYCSGVKRAMSFGGWCEDEIREER